MLSYIGNIQHYSDVHNGLFYNVYSNNGVKIRAEMNGISQIIDIDDRHVTFNFTLNLND